MKNKLIQGFRDRQLQIQVSKPGIELKSQCFYLLYCPASMQHTLSTLKIGCMCNASAYVCKLFLFIFCLFSVKGKEARSNLGDTHVLLLRELENTNS